MRSGTERLLATNSFQSGSSDFGALLPMCVLPNARPLLRQPNQRDHCNQEAAGNR